MRRFAMGAAAAVLLLGIAPAQAATDFDKLIVKGGKLTAEGTLGANCRPYGDGKGACYQAAYPLKITGWVRVRRGGTVEVLLGAPARAVNYRLARPAANDSEQTLMTKRAHRMTKTGKRWLLQLPKKFGGKPTILGVGVLYANAVSDFEVGAKL